LEAIEQICGVGTAYSKDSVRAVLASAQDCNLLEIPSGSPVLAADGLAFDEKGEPIRLSRAIYRGDRFRLATKSTANQASVLVVENTGF
jgi:DNA-binding GntR family transcriptional regulator